MELLVASLCFLTVGNVGILVVALATARRARDLADRLLREPTER